MPAPMVSPFTTLSRLCATASVGTAWNGPTPIAGFESSDTAP
jgi:hypothetical protein